MDLTPSISSSMPADAGSQAPRPAIPVPSDTEVRTAIQRVLDEAGKSTGRAVRPEDLLLHLLSEPEGLGQEALQAAGVKPQRVRAELLRLMGHADDVARPPVERVPWPLSRWAWISAALSSIAYPLSIGPALLVIEKLDLKSSTEAALEVVYFPIIWLYETVPLVEAFYDWYLEIIGYS